MGGHGHGPPYTVPSFKDFKIEGIKQLEELQVALAKKGLKDPWIRNEAWRYHPAHGTAGARARRFFLRGAPAGIVIGIVGAVISKMLEPHDDDHHH